MKDFWRECRHDIKDMFFILVVSATILSAVSLMATCEAKTHHMHELEEQTKETNND